MKIIQNFLQETNIADDLAKLIGSEKDKIKSLQTRLKTLKDKYALDKAIPAKKSLTAAVDDMIAQLKKSMDNLKDMEDKNKRKKK